MNNVRPRAVCPARQHVSSQHPLSNLIWKWFLHSQGFPAVKVTLHWPHRCHLTLTPGTKLHSVLSLGKAEANENLYRAVIHNQVIRAPFAAAEQWCDCDSPLAPNYQTNFLLNNSSSPQPWYLIKFSHCFTPLSRCERNPPERKNTSNAL